MPNQKFISRNRAITERGITPARLEREIRAGNIRIIYTGTRSAKVCEADVLHALSTPPAPIPAPAGE